MSAAKFVVALLGAGVTAALGLGLTGTLQQILTVAAAVLTAAGVYLVPNTPAPPPGVTGRYVPPGR